MLQEKRVVTSFLESDGEILILRRSGRVGTYQGKWSGVSGYIEPGVEPYKQALTEIKEETGLSGGDIILADSAEPLTIEDAGINTKWVIYPFIFHVIDRSKIRLDWENTGCKWIKPDDIRALDTVPGLKDALERVMKKSEL
jgi:8-oxo-dGTP pyrophosphatase MutT (NUDIX family)